MPNNSPQGDKVPLNLGRPVDQSYAAFKDWIDQMSKVFGATGEMSEEEMQAAYRQFWEGTPAPEQPPAS